MLTGSDVALTLPKAARRDMTVKIFYQTPIPAPIVAGAPLGRIEIAAPGKDKITVPLLAASDVGRLGTWGRVNAAAQYLLWGKSAK